MFDFITFLDFYMHTKFINTKELNMLLFFHAIFKNLLHFILMSA